jgi:hypothetical protein
MQYCHKERSNFPDDQFTVKAGVRMHTPIGRAPESSHERAD